MDKIAAHYLGGSEKPIVFSEPGATLISKYISFLTKVKDIKTVAGRTVAVTDGSFYNLGEISLKKQLPLTVIRNGDDNYHGEYDIVGYTCLEYDTNDCPNASQCRTLYVWEGLKRVVSEYLDGISIQDIIDHSNDSGNDYCI